MKRRREKHAATRYFEREAKLRRRARDHVLRLYVFVIMHRIACELRESGFPVEAARQERELARFR